MADMTEMEMALQENTVPMMTGEGPFGSVEMGGMFNVVKVRSDLPKGVYSDPGWYAQGPRADLVSVNQRLNGQAKETNPVFLMSILQENQCLIRKDDHEKRSLLLGLSLLTAISPVTLLAGPGHGNEEHSEGFFTRLKNAVFGSYGEQLPSVGLERAVKSVRKLRLS